MKTLTASFIGSTIYIIHLFSCLFEKKNSGAIIKFKQGSHFSPKISFSFLKPGTAWTKRII